MSKTGEMYVIYDKFESTVHNFNPSSARDVSDFRKLMISAPELAFVEVSTHWIKFQDSPYTTHPDKSVTVYPKADNSFSRANIKMVLGQSNVFGEPSTIAQIERKLASLDAGAVFTIEDGSVRFLGTTFVALGRNIA